MDGLPRKMKFATKRHICKRHTTSLSCSVKQTNISPDLALLSYINNVARFVESPVLSERKAKTKPGS